MGIDFYPRHALLSRRGWTLYLDGSRRPWQRFMQRSLFVAVHRRGRALMVSEGQAEPWEAVTVPPNPPGRAMYSCLPEHVVENYNQMIRCSRDAQVPLHSYLFWGAEYWMLRKQSGDSSYLDAFGRILRSA